MVFYTDDRLWEFLGTDTSVEGGYCISYTRFIYEFMNKEDSDHLIHRFNDLVEHRTSPPSGEMLIRVKRRDGTERHLNVFYRIMYDCEEPNKIYGVAMDVTDRIETKTKLWRWNRELLAVKEINKAIVRANSLDVLFDEVCRLMCEVRRLSFRLGRKTAG